MHLHTALKIPPELDGCKGLLHSAFIAWLKGKGGGEERVNKNAGKHRLVLKMTQLVQL